MKQTKYSIVYFGTTYLLFAGILALGMIFQGKPGLHLLLTGYNSPWLDTFFRYFTEMGGFVPFLVGVLFVFYRFGAALYILSTQLVNALLTYWLKKSFGMPRPKTFFAEHFPDITLNQVEGVTMHAWNSFPSGHTASVFAMVTCIALMTKNKLLSVMLCLIACIAGYSRIYLSQHFAEDVLAGSLTGILYALLLFPLYKSMILRYKWTNKLLSFSIADAKKND